MKTKLFLQALPLIALTLALVPLNAQTVTWERKAFGQAQPNPCGGTFAWPNNNFWGQQERLATACNATYVAEPSNWSTATYPNSTTVNVSIPAEPVALNVGVTVGTLQLASGGSLFMGQQSLTVANGSLVNNGVITAKNNHGAAFLTFTSNATISGSGEILLFLNGASDAGVQIVTTGGATLTQAAGHRIRGAGTINAKLINNGLVSSDAAVTSGNFSTLWLGAFDMTNNGTFQAIDGHTLQLTNTNLTQAASAQIVADNGSVVLNGATVTGGTLASSNNGSFWADGTRLNNITNNAVVGVGYTALGAGPFVNNGDISIYGNPNTGTLEFTGDTTVSGTGRIASVRGGYSVLKIAPGYTLTNGPGHTIGGNGLIRGRIVNHGIIVPTADSYFQVLSSEGGSSLANAGGDINVPANTTLSFESTVPFTQTSGVIRLTGGELVVPGGVDVNGGTLLGSGTIHGSIRNNGGVVAPGLSPGKITINGNYSQGADGVLDIEIGGAAPGTGYDQLRVNGTATLGGTLNVTLINGFQPAVGDVFQIIAPNAFSGAFATINTVGFSGTVNYSSTGIALTVNSAAGIPLNISTRMHVGADPNQLIGGFIITGAEPKKVIVLATGPSLAAFGITDFLADPIIELYQGNTLIGSNDNWKNPAQAEIEATGLKPGHDLESVLVRTLDPGAYTAVIRGTNGTGVGTVQVYDLSPATQSKLANISSRGFVQTADDRIMIAGFIIGGNGGGNSGIVVRAIAPSLSGVIAGVLPDPTLELKDANGSTLVFNDDWQQSPQAADISARGLAPSDSHESALGVSLSNGAYTAIVRGKAGATGVAVVEVYNVD